MDKLIDAESLLDQCVDPTPTPTPAPVKSFRSWEDFDFSGGALQEIGKSIYCLSGPCLQSATIPDGRYSIMWLKLYSYSDPRYESWMDGETISFQVKASTQSSDVLTFALGGQSIGEWSGTTDWTTQVFYISVWRPTMLEWKYRKDGIASASADAVWIKEIELIQR